MTPGMPTRTQHTDVHLQIGRTIPTLVLYGSKCSAKNKFARLQPQLNLAPLNKVFDCYSKPGMEVREWWSSSSLPSGRSMIMYDNHLRWNMRPTCNIVIILPARERHVALVRVTLAQAGVRGPQLLTTKKNPRLKICYAQFEHSYILARIAEVDRQVVDIDQLDHLPSHPVTCDPLGYVSR